MAGATRTSVPMVLLVLFLVSYGIPAAHADAAFVSRTCKKTKNPKLCMDVLSMDQHSSQAITVHELTIIALDIASTTAKFITMNMKVGAKYNQGTPLGHALDICFRAYDDATYNLKQSAKQSLDGRDYVGALKTVLGARDVATMCDNEFKRIKKDPPKEDDRHMIERCGVTGELIRLLIHN